MIQTTSIPQARTLNSNLLALLHIWPSTAVYDAVFFEEQQEEKKITKFRALVWKIDSLVGTLYEFPKLSGSERSFFRTPDMVDSAGIKLGLESVIDVYSSQFLAVEGTLTEEDERVQQFERLLEGQIPEQCSILHQITVVPRIFRDWNGWQVVEVEATIPVKVLPSKIVFASVHYAFPFDTPIFFDGRELVTNETPRIIFCA